MPYEVYQTCDDQLIEISCILTIRYLTSTWRRDKLFNL